MTFMSFILTEMEIIWEVKLNFVMMDSPWSNALHTSADVLSCLTDFFCFDLFDFHHRSSTFACAFSYFILEFIPVILIEVSQKIDNIS